MDDDLRYKEYKAQVPPKWATFDRPQGIPKQRRGFAAFLKAAISQSENADIRQSEFWSLHSADNDNQDDDDGGDHTTKGSKKRDWMVEMQAYCKEQEHRATAKEKSVQLEKELKRRQERANAQREKILSAATGGGGGAAMASSTVGFGQRDQHKELLCSAMEIETSILQRNYENRIADRYQRREAVLQKHNATISEKNRAVAAALQERSQYIHDTVVEKETRAQKRFHESQEKRRKRLEGEIAASEARSKELEERLALSREALNGRRAEMRADFERKIAESAKIREAKDEEYERQLEAQFEATNQRLLASQLLQAEKVAQDRVGKALARAEAVRVAQRSAQLAECEAAEKRRKRAIQEKMAQDNDWQQAVYQRNRDREQRAQHRIEKTTDASLSRHERAIKERSKENSRLDKSTSPSRSAILELSHVASDVSLHLSRHEEELMKHMEAALLVEQAEYDRHIALEKRKRDDLKQLQEEAAKADERRRDIRRRAEESRRQREELVLRNAEQRQKRSEKHLQELQSEVRETMHAANASKAQKARDAMELVHVTQRQELMRQVQAKEEKAARMAAEQEAIRLEQLKEKQREQEDRWLETMQHIQEINADKESKLMISMQHKKELADRATVQREDATLALQKKLQAQAETREAAMRAEERHREERYVKSLAALAKKDASIQSLQEQRQRAAAEYHDYVSQQRTTRTLQAFERLDKIREEKLLHTVEKLEANYGRHTPHERCHHDFHAPLPRPHSTL